VTQAMEESLPELVPARDGMAVRISGRHLYHREHPRAYASRRAEAAHVQPETLVLVASPLLGYGLDTVLSRLPADSLVVACEVDARLWNLARSEHALPLPYTSPDATSSAGQSLAGYSAGRPPPASCGSLRPVYLCNAASVEDAMGLLYPLIQQHGFRRVQLISLSGGYRLHSEAYRHLEQLAAEAIARRWTNRATEMHMSRLWHTNLLINASAPALPMPSGAVFGDIPVLVVGAGPSLEHALPKLRARRPEALILAVDTALPPLLDYGVEPDFVLVADAQFTNVADLRRGIGLRPIFFFERSAHPSAVAACPPDRRTFLDAQITSTAVVARLRQKGLLGSAIPALGSVGVMAAYVALQFTKGPLFLLGLDFAYLRGKPHARGALSSLYELERLRRTSPPLLYSQAVVRNATPASFGGQSDGVGKPTLLTDAALRGYEAQARSLCTPERCTVLGEYTPALPHLPRSPVEHLLELSRQESDDLSGNGFPRNRGRSGKEPGILPDPCTLIRRNGPSSPATDTVRFLNHELHLLETCIRELRSAYFAGGAAAGTRGELGRVEAVHGGSTETPTGNRELPESFHVCDYIAVDFPDRERVTEPSPALLARLLESAQDYRRRLTRALRVAERRATGLLDW